MTSQDDKLRDFDLHSGARDLGEWTQEDEANRLPPGSAIAVLLVLTIAAVIVGLAWAVAATVF